MGGGGYSDPGRKRRLNPVRDGGLGRSCQTSPWMSKGLSGRASPLTTDLEVRIGEEEERGAGQGHVRESGYLDGGHDGHGVVGRGGARAFQGERLLLLRDQRAHQNLLKRDDDVRVNRTAPYPLFSLFTTDTGRRRSALTSNLCEAILTLVLRWGENTSQSKGSTRPSRL